MNEGLGFLLIPILMVLVHLGRQQVPAGALPGITGEGCMSLMLFAETEEKTEAATPHRRQEARKKGQVARSSDLNSTIVILAVIVTLYSLRGYVGDSLADYLRQILGSDMGITLTSDRFFHVSKMTLYLCLQILSPIFAAAIVFGILINFAQVGMVVAAEKINPKLSNINPIEGFKRIFSKRALVEFAKTMIKVLVIGSVTYKLIQKALPQIITLLHMDLASSMGVFAKLAFRVSITAVAIFLVIAVLDLVYQKWEYGQSLRMSKDEIKKEMKQTEGDPMIKARIREKQRLMSMNRMMQSIPEATVLIINPEHLAVALKYDEKSMEAPQIVAKGAGYVAQRIKEKAAEYKIPVVEDKQLARALYKTAEIGDFVPVELYQAVAGVIAAIYALKKNR